MKKTLVLAVAAFFAVNIAGITTLNAQDVKKETKKEVVKEQKVVKDDVKKVDGKANNEAACCKNTKECANKTECSKKVEAPAKTETKEVKKDECQMKKDAVEKKTVQVEKKKGTDKVITSGK